MRVLFLTNVPSPYRVDFFNEIGKAVDLTVVFERENAKSRNAEWISDNFKNFKYFFLKGIKYGDDGLISFKVKKFLKKDFDIIMFGNYHTPTSIIAARYCIKKKIPYALSVDGIFKHDNENKFKLKMKKKIFSQAEFFVTSGNYSVDVIKYYGGSNCYIYPFTSVHDNYVLNKPISIEEKQKLKNELNLKNNLILFVGQTIARKGIDILFKVFSNLSNCQLLVIGGTLNEEYQKLKRELAIDVDVIPFLKSKELEKYYLASDVFVLPTREDQWGLVINEALAKGLPVVSSTMCLSCYEMIKDNGYMVEVEDIDGYVKAINNIFNLSAEKYSLLQENAIKVAKEYTIEKMAERHVAIFKEVISKR